MAGIYIHIPFCKTRCVYCDFFTGTNEREIDRYVQTLCAEAQLRKEQINEPIETIYLGGGTPSRLSQNHFWQIFDAIFALFDISPDAEITLEANPDDLSVDYISQLSQLPFNRISIGIQSFNNDELRFLSRRHSAQQAADAVKNCQNAGFNNISIDLMYGLPNQTGEIWQKNLQAAADLNIQHISAYHLIYEEKTKLYSLLQKGSIQPVSDEISTAMFSMLIDFLAQNGFGHYEISNFARQGKYSRHNRSYWQNKKYIGLGAAAHSFDGENRWWNIASLSKYMDAVEQGTLLQETEHLSPQQKYNETILTGLRTMWGINLSEVNSRFGQKMHDYCLQNAQKFIPEKLLVLENNHLKLTRKGIFISDGIMSDLMWVE